MTGRSSRSKRRGHSRVKRRTSDSSHESCLDSVNVRHTPPRNNRHNSPSDRHDRSSRRRNGSHSPRSSRKYNRDITVDRIFNRLEAIEARLPISVENDSPLRPTNQSRLLSASLAVPTTASEPSSRMAEEVTEGSDMNTSGTKEVESSIVGALTSLFKANSQNFFISPFDPNVHDFDVCSSKGDAKSWLNDWVTNDRSWSNFKQEFKSLWPRNIDIASVLYDVMSTNSNKYSTYAEYARKSLLRLNIVKGLSDELKTAIVVRGIVDPQIKAATTNAKLSSKDLVEFLSVYIKPKPLIDDHVDKLGSYKIFTSLDMATGFHQVPMKDDDSISKTAFVTPEGHYEYLKMPYGLANAPIVYQRIISKTLKTLIDAEYEQNDNHHVARDISVTNDASDAAVGDAALSGTHYTPTQRTGPGEGV
ncbi:unnamed protein product [Euphydryas editha]|uniref:Reverse transcriptase domain-containing protein n=1 Tax=Euphydryas editha TaxID=104508 RepID=A0AAU9TZV0_EUPED|nr:unnamed protein product [Euphydryas editha]